MTLPENNQLGDLADSLLSEWATKRKRAADCVNALAGIENPAAFVAAFEGMERALLRARGQLVAHLLDDMNAGQAGKEVSYIDTALQSARAARGEV